MTSTSADLVERPGTSAPGLVAETPDRPVFSFIVPCYNESPNVRGAVAEIERAALDAGLDHYEIVLVNDGSSDDTGAVISGLAAERSHVRALNNPVNLGLGGAYKQGLRHATGTYVMMVPGDNAHPAEGITPLIREQGGADIIIPYVINKEARSWLRRLASRLFTGLVNRLFALKVPYYNGLVVHRLELLRDITIETDSFAYQAEALIRLLKRGATFKAVGVPIRERNQGKSSAFRLANVIRTLSIVLELKRQIG